SDPGEGTVVTLLFPRCSPAAETVMEDAREAASATLEGLRVLLVEDDPSVARLVGELLEELGASVDRAGTADEALQVFAEKPAGAVVSDMVMPGTMNGLDLARKLRECRPRLPILLMTGYSAAAGSAAEQGFPVLRKPFTSDELAARLSEAVQRYSREGN